MRLAINNYSIHTQFLGIDGALSIEMERIGEIETSAKLDLHNFVSPAKAGVRYI